MAEVERRWLRARRYVFHPDEIAEAEAQGLPYVLLPRVLSRREWIERYGGQPPADPGDEHDLAPSAPVQPTRPMGAPAWRFTGAGADHQR